jgi:hypothetical protein
MGGRDYGTDRGKEASGPSEGVKCLQWLRDRYFQLHKTDCVLCSAETAILVCSGQSPFAQNRAKDAAVCCKPGHSVLSANSLSSLICIASSLYFVMFTQCDVNLYRSVALDTARWHLSCGHLQQLRVQ